MPPMPPMPRAARLVALLALALATGAVLPGPLAAQTEFAVPLAPGQVRLDITPWWQSWDHRYDPSSPGTPTPINAYFESDSFGVASLPFLAPLQSEIRKASGQSGFTLDLGRTTAAMTASVRTIPIGLELGLTKSLAIGVTVPIVRSQVYVGFKTDSTRPGNVYWNDTTATAAFRGQLAAVLAALQTQATSGPAALRAQAQALLDTLQPYVGVSRALFLPQAGSAAGAGIAGRLDSMETAYAQLAAQYGDSGVSLPALTAALPLPDSVAVLGRQDLESFFSDPAGPMAADTFGNLIRTGIGDITAHATWQFADAKTYRGQLLFTVRFPTGSAPAANEFMDLGTGTHQLGFEAALANDLVLGNRFLIHGVARVGGASSDQIPMRVTPPWLPFAPVAQQAVIRRTPAPWAGLEVSPTWLLDDAFSARVSFGYFAEGAMKHAYADPADSARVGMPASVLDENTAVRWTRLGAGVTFSTVARYAAGKASLPYDLTVSYANTIWGSAWVPKISQFSVALRAYISVFR